MTFDITNLNCTQQDCSASTYDYTIYGPDWKKHKMTVNYESYPSREIYNNGNKFRKFDNFVSKNFDIYPGEDTRYHCGDVISGPCKGAIVCETVHYPNPNPGACYMKPGVTKLDTDFAFLNIKNCGKDYIACSGGGYQTFTPGLRS
jgi:hypothetical protein